MDTTDTGNTDTTHPANTQAATSIMQRLRDETAEQHADAESRPLERAMAGGTLPRDVYVAWLGQRFLLHTVLEALVRDVAERDPRVGPIVTPDLFQENNLRADLQFFERPIERLQPLPPVQAICDAWRRLTDAKSAGSQPAGSDQTTTQPIALLGAYYVFEGSKNGARYLMPRVAKTHGLDAELRDGLLYLDPHGERQRPLWMAFKERMNAATFTPAEQDAMVAAAKQAFSGVSALDDALYAETPAK